MEQPLNFQSIIMTLQKFWAERGCLIWQPYYTQVGAGTMNPATYLRVLGPEPWNVGYVEPSIRPDDGRYGENPNRMQMHYQFQVILKPDPGNPLEIYLQSLEALGIDPRKHDIRFVEDNWESPALGAWGLGWEVWLNGQEITQFTYFQQAGGIVLDPVSVEITYGLERIAIALQQVSNFRDIQWSPSLTDGDVNLQAEQEHSKYYFEIANIDRLRQMYDLFEAEANCCLAEGLVLPAHDYVLKCSHTFNVLDTRGAVGVTERQALFGRMRELSRKVAEAYVDQRQRLEFPWLQGKHGECKQKQPSAHIVRPDENEIQTGVAPFLLEIGTEELPASDLTAALNQLQQRVPEWLNNLRLNFEGLRIEATPRRLVVFVEKLAVMQADLEQIVKGPPADRAFDADGRPTKAAEGFARSKGVAVDELVVREMDGGRYVAAVVHQSGQPVQQVLAQEIPALLGAIRFDKSMRWNSSNVSFSRPVRWLLAILGENETCQVIPFNFAGLQSGAATRGLRFLQPSEWMVQSPKQYFETLTQQGILLCLEERKAVIQQQIYALAEEVGGVIEDDPALLAEVASLVEAPTALRGSFSSSYLDLPREVLVSVMKKHQRYFPVLKADDSQKLLPYFIAVRNGHPEWLDVVTQGNEHVIRARFADAAFFVREDLKKPLRDYVPLLSSLTFQVKLGSMLDKTRRITALVEDLNRLLGYSQDDLLVAKRAAELCKADLATKMVVEMTSLQGLMGRHYALASDEAPAVAQAIFEHYLPRATGDLIPESKAGFLVGLADRLDSLAGLFAVGLAPSGNKDPFAQRRAALGIVQNLAAWDVDFDVRQALQMAAQYLPVTLAPDNQAAVVEFIVERLRNVLLETSTRYDIVDSVLSAQGHNPASASREVKALTSWVSRSDWQAILPAYARCVRITRDLDEKHEVNSSLLSEAEERDLYTAILAAENTPRRCASVDDFLNTFLPMIPIVNRFFDRVLVMAEDLSVRKNRLGLLQRIADLAQGIADLSKLEGF